MTARRVRRISYLLAGGYLLLNAVINARPIAYLLLIPTLPAEMRDPKAASLSVTKAILEVRLSEATQMYQAQLETSRRAYEIELPEDQLLTLDEDLAKAKAAMTLAWLEWAAT